MNKVHYGRNTIRNMKIKTGLLFLTLLLASFSMLGQTYRYPPNNLEYDQDKWHFGFTLGPEFQNMRIVNNSESIIDDPNYNLPNGVSAENVYVYSDIQNLSPGFHVGIITSRRIGEYFNLRFIPSLSLGQKTIKSKFYFEDENLNIDWDDGLGNYLQEPIITTIKSTYISLPVLVKYKAVRIENVRPYLVAGASLKYDLATDFEDPITLKKIDTSLEFGLGSDFYMKTFRLGVEVRFGIGLMNVLQTDRPASDDKPYLTASMDKITAKTFTIALNFE